MFDTSFLGPLLLIFIFAWLAFICFVIYFFFKILQFVIQATNLYKRILKREDAIIKVLLDIRDNTKKVDIDWGQLDSESVTTRVRYCPTCGSPDVYYDTYSNLFCPNCKKVIDPHLASQSPPPTKELKCCPRCGKPPEDADADFCEECGTRLQ